MSAKIYKRMLLGLIIVMLAMKMCNLKIHYPLPDDINI